MYIPTEHFGVTVIANTHTAQLPFPTAAAHTIALGVLRLYHHQSPAPVTTQRQVYLVLDLILLAAVTGVGLHAFRLRGWRQRALRSRIRPGALISLIVLDGMLPLVILLVLPPLLGTLTGTLTLSPFYNWPAMFAINPDLAYTVFAIAVVLLGVGIVKLAWMFQARRSR